MKRLALPLLLLLTACAYDASGLTAPVVRQAIAQAQITTTQQARNDIQLQLTLTALPPAQTRAAFTAEADALAATRRSGDATRTQVADANRATDRAATPTQAARLTLTAAPPIAEMTRQAGAESLLKFNQRQQFVLTQAAGQAQFESAKYGALELGIWIVVVFGAAAVGIILLALAVRVAGPDLISFGEGVSRVIIARANAYNTRALADNHGGEIDQPPPIASIGAGENWHVARWKQAAWLFLTAGNKHGFTIRALGSAGERIVTDPGWEQMTRWLRDDLQILTDNNGTEWAEDWDMMRFRAGYPAWHPTPPLGQPPTVAAVVRGATTLQRATTLPEGG